MTERIKAIPDLDALEAALAKAEWARDWPHNIVPPGKPANELACMAIRALPALLSELRSLREQVKAAKIEGLSAAEQAVRKVMKLWGADETEWHEALEAIRNHIEESRDG